jgi:hypothetical protein
MPRNLTPACESAAPPIHVIAPTAVYSVDDARRLLRLKQSSVRREVRAGRLRVSKRCGRYFLLGQWLLAWIREGELPRRGHVSEHHHGEQP